jgi:hypothetical protein
MLGGGTDIASQRQAFIGFVASIASDTVSNSLRVVKTYRQVHERDVGYCEWFLIFPCIARVAS